MTIHKVTKVIGIKLPFTQFLAHENKQFDEDDADCMYEHKSEYSYREYAPGTVAVPTESGDVPDTLFTFIPTHDLHPDCDNVLIIGLILSHDVTRDKYRDKEWFDNSTPFKLPMSLVFKVTEMFEKLRVNHPILTPSYLKPALYTIYDDCVCCS